MTLKEVLTALIETDEGEKWSLKAEVVFNTKERSNLHLLSTYMVDGVLHVDIGDAGE